jgi:hypothetical protein
VGFLDALSSTKRPAAGTPVLSKEEVLARLKALNRPTAPYRVVDGAEEKVDLIAEWKVVDATWYQIFEKANLSKVFRVYLKLDDKNHEVRAMDREYTVAWSAGVPSLSIAATAFKGQMQSVEFGKAYAFTEKMGVDEVYSYRFDTGEIKKPLQQAVTASGWTYRGVAFGKL